MKAKSCLRCFSLVELLSVTCIAVALIALLFPALERAKGMARKTFCKANLQQMISVVNLYKTDNRGALPYYNENWLVNFSFLKDYINGFDIAVCPDTDDSVTGEDDLTNGNTSYHYMGSRYDWEKNSSDGSGYGFDLSNATIASLLSSREEKVIYDRSDAFHYGMFNVVYLESGHVESLPASSYSNFWFYDDAGPLSLDTSSDRTKNCARNRNRYRHGNTDADSEYSDNGSSDTTTTTTTTTASTEDGKNNNGHGNNEDGVDCSNPGQGNGGPNGTEDASGTVDDESKGGGSSSSDGNSGNNGNGNGNGKNK